MSRRDGDDDEPGVSPALLAGDPHDVVVVVDALHGGVQHDPVAEFSRRRVGDLLRACRKTVLLSTVFHVEHPIQATACPYIAGGVQHRHVVGFASPGHPRHDGQQIPRGGAGMHRSQPLSQRLAVQPGGAAGGPRLGQRNCPRDALELPTHAAGVDQAAQREPRDRAGAAHIYRDAGDMAGVRAPAHPVAAFENQHIVSAPRQFAGRRESGETGPHHDDVGGPGRVGHAP